MLAPAQYPAPSAATPGPLEIVPLTAAGGRDGRNLGLDIVRAVAITMVLASHTLTDFLPPLGVIMVQWGGKAGVELFFSLSGFLIGTILIRASSAQFGPREVGLFLFRRWMRTLPAYYAWLLFAGWFFGAYPLHSFLLLQNFYPEEPRYLVVSWSLVMEEYFYFFFPLTMLLLHRFVGRGVRLVLPVACGIAAVCMAGRVAGAFVFDTVPTNALSENPFARMDCAAYGVIAACLVQMRPDVLRWVQRFRAAMVCAGLSLLALQAGLFVAVLTIPPETMVKAGFLWWGRLYLMSNWTLTDITSAVLVLALFTTRPALPGWLRLGVHYVSLWSYSIYLTHTVVIVLVSYYAPSTTHRFAGFVLVLACTFLVSWASFQLVERPGVLLRDWMTQGRRRRPAA